MTGPFVMGSLVWPGLSKLVEECGEVVQVCGKIMQKPDCNHWSGDLSVMLHEEIGDNYAALDFMVDKNGLDRDAIEARRAMKRGLYEQWHAEESEG